MGFKRLKCPVCGQEVSFFWNYFSIRQMIYNYSNCNTKIKWHLIMGLYSLIGGIIMLSIFYIIKDYIGSPYLALIIGFIPGQIVSMLLPKKVKIISKDEEK